MPVIVKQPSLHLRDHRITVGVQPEVTTVEVEITVGIVIHREVIMEITANRITPAVAMVVAVDVVEAVEEEQEGVTETMEDLHRKTWRRRRRL